MKENLLLLNLLEQLLGKSKTTARHNHSFFCPNGCHPTKHKLEINLINKKYQCWICGDNEGGFRGQSLFKLFKKLEATPEQFNELSKLIDAEPQYKETISHTILQLPKETQYFENNNTLEARRAKAYLKSRGVTDDDIIKYGIGYCKEGEYENMLIIPSYDSDGSLNYFSTRSFIKGSFKKFQNPNVSRDIIAFDLFINWNSPIILCEAMLDAIAIKRNVIPLLGKNIQSNLMKKIISSPVDKIYLALDPDVIKLTIRYAEKFMNEGLEVYIVDLKEDPNETGFQKITEIIQHTEPETSYSLMERKLNLI